MGRGGILPKQEVPSAAAAAKTQAAAAAAAMPGAVAMPARLCVEDPLTGRDVAGGTNRILQVPSRPACLPACMLGWMGVQPEGQRQAWGVCAAAPWLL